MVCKNFYFQKSRFGNKVQSIWLDKEMDYKTKAIYTLLKAKVWAFIVELEVVAENFGGLVWLAFGPDMFGPGSVLKLNQPDNSLHSNTSDYCIRNESLGSITHNPTSLKHKKLMKLEFGKPSNWTAGKSIFVVG